MLSVENDLVKNNSNTGHSNNSLTYKKSLRLIDGA